VSGVVGMAAAWAEAMYCRVPNAREASTVVTGVGPPRKPVGFLVPLPDTKAAPSPAPMASAAELISQSSTLKKRSSSDSSVACGLAMAMPKVGATSARSGVLVWLRVSFSPTHSKAPPPMSKSSL